MDLLVRFVIVAAVLAGAAAIGWWWNRRQGVVREDHGGFTPEQLDQLGVDARGGDAVGVLLGSPTCGPCEAVKTVLTELEEEVPTFRWVYADAADHLQIASDHHVLRVPTLFVLAADGRILARTSGVPARHDLRRVIDRPRLGPRV